jgi:hypothetical protein
MKGGLYIMARPLYPGEKNEHSTDTPKRRKKGIIYLFKKIRYWNLIRRMKKNGVR